MNVLENMKHTTRIWLSVIAGGVAFLVLWAMCHFGWSLFWGIVVGIIVYIVLGLVSRQNTDESSSALNNNTHETPDKSDVSAKHSTQNHVSKSETEQMSETEQKIASAPMQSESSQPEVKHEAVTQAPADQDALEEQQPEILSAPREGGADDLKKIKGVGPKLEGVLNELGFWHFEQIAAWTDNEVSWVDSRLKFKGRIARDNWIEQAKNLA